MASIKYLTIPNFKGDLTNIRVRFYNGKKFDVSAQTNILINPDHWNSKSGKIRQRLDFHNSESFQEKLDDLKAFILSSYKDSNEKDSISKDWLISVIDKFHNPAKQKKAKTTLFDYIQDFIQNSSTRLNLKTGMPVCYKMQREYQVTFNYLKEYAEKFQEPDFIDIDLDFYNKFVSFLREKRLATNTIGKKVQTLKIFLNAASEKGINQFSKYKSKNFKTLSEESENIYLNEKELEQFYNFDFSQNERLEKVRDLFIVAAWTGLRYSDIPQVIMENIKDEILTLRQKKTKDKVSIPIHPFVNSIIKKYQNKLPKPISNQKFNDYLKEAAKIAGISETVRFDNNINGMRVEKNYFKYELISSHTGRRSFCTNAYKMGIPTLAIMSISGHRTEQAFLKYIKADDKDHAYKVLEAWKNTGNFLKVI